MKSLKLVVASLILTAMCFGQVPKDRPAKTAEVKKPFNPNAIVWVNTKSKKYFCSGSRWYGNTTEGKSMKQDAAKAAGFVPAKVFGLPAECK